MMVWDWAGATPFWVCWRCYNASAFCFPQVGASSSEEVDSTALKICFFFFKKKHVIASLVRFRITIVLNRFLCYEIDALLT